MCNSMMHVLMDGCMCVCNMILIFLFTMLNFYDILCIYGMVCHCMYVNIVCVCFSVCFVLLCDDYNSAWCGDWLHGVMIDCMVW